MITATQNRTRTSRLRAVLGALAAVTGLALVASPASASEEFPNYPAASFEATCAPGPFILVNVSNVNGSTVVPILVTVANGTDSITTEVPALPESPTTASISDAAIAMDGRTVTVTAEAEGQVLASQSFAMDCTPDEIGQEPPSLPSTGRTTSFLVRLALGVVVLGLGFLLAGRRGLV